MLLDEQIDDAADNSERCGGDTDQIGSVVRAGLLSPLEQLRAAETSNAVAEHHYGEIDTVVLIAVLISYEAWVCAVKRAVPLPPLQKRSCPDRFGDWQCRKCSKSA